MTYAEQLPVAQNRRFYTIFDVLLEYLLIIALLIAWGQFFMWSTREKLMKDEMGRQIIQRSASLSYQILFVALLLLWLADFFYIHQVNNYTLFIALCIAFLTHLLIQFFQVKKY